MGAYMYSCLDNTHSGIVHIVVMHDTCTAVLIFIIIVVVTLALFFVVRHYIFESGTTVCCSFARVLVLVLVCSCARARTPGNIAEFCGVLRRRWTLNLAWPEQYRSSNEAALFNCCFKCNGGGLSTVEVDAPPSSESTIEARQWCGATPFDAGLVGVPQA